MSTTFTRTEAVTSDPKDWWRRVCWVNSRLAVSGDLPEDSADALEHLSYWEAEGITDVLDLREEADDSDFIEALSDIRPHRFGIDDDGSARPDQWFDAITKCAAKVLSHPNRRILVHCFMGVSRSPSALFAIMLTQGWGAVQALDAIRTARPIAGILYARDAVNWWSRSSGHTRLETLRHEREVSTWLDENRIDIGEIIRRIRQ